MTDFKEGDKAWIMAVFTKTKMRSKVHCIVSEVTITKLFEDDTCLVTDEEDIGMYTNIDDLYVHKEEALLNAYNGLHKWNNHDNEIMNSCLPSGKESIEASIEPA